MEITIQSLSIKDIQPISELTQFLNPSMAKDLLIARQRQMFDNINYTCFGLFTDNQLIGVAGVWLTTRLYSGKQAEIDNFIIHTDYQSRGFGQKLVLHIEHWARQQQCESVELNTYISNTASHRFYENQQFIQLGYHYVKRLT